MVGHDVLLRELKVGGLTSREVVKELVKQSRSCADLRLQGCQQQVRELLWWGRKQMIGDYSFPVVSTDRAMRKYFVLYIGL